MNNTKLYVIIGVLVGIVLVLLISKFPGEPLGAQTTRLSSGPANGFIALTAETRGGKTIMWLIDTKRKNLLTYELVENPSRAKLSAIRDIQYDLDVPDSIYYPARTRGDERTPMEIKKMMQEAKEKLKRK